MFSYVDAQSCVYDFYQLWEFYRVPSYHIINLAYITGLTSFYTVDTCI